MGHTITFNLFATANGRFFRRGTLTLTWCSGTVVGARATSEIDVPEPGKEESRKPDSEQAVGKDDDSLPPYLEAFRQELLERVAEAEKYLSPELKARRHECILLEAALLRPEPTLEEIEEQIAEVRRQVDSAEAESLEVQKKFPSTADRWQEVIANLCSNLRQELPELGDTFDRILDVAQESMGMLDDARLLFGAVAIVDTTMATRNGVLRMLDHLGRHYAKCGYDELATVLFDEQSLVARSGNTE